ncbi:MAG: hypothetical protein K2Z80_27020 [Xanthobacteraceae bacterium]|nr:hypothetical protein [Xanthobacteraceae bacterium]
MDTRFLAQLRLAEFPQRNLDTVPTCADLIEGCGAALQRVEWNRPATEWTAYSRDGSAYGGQTPEDALANLWLATHRQFDRETIL